MVDAGALNGLGVLSNSESLVFFQAFVVLSRIKQRVIRLALFPKYDCLGQVEGAFACQSNTDVLSASASGEIDHPLSGWFACRPDLFVILIIVADPYRQSRSAFMELLLMTVS